VRARRQIECNLLARFACSPRLLDWSPQESSGVSEVSEFFQSFGVFGISEFQSFGVSEFRSFGFSEFRSFGVLEFWIFGVSEFQSFRVSEFQSFRVSEFRNFRVPSNAPLVQLAAR